MKSYLLLAVGGAVGLVVAGSGDASTPIAGSYRLSILVAATTPVASASKITCTASLDVEPDSGPSIQESATATATLVSGTSYNCTLTIPYRWDVNSTTGSIYPNFDVNVVGTTETRARTNSTLPTLPLPANNASLVQSVTVRM